MRKKWRRCNTPNPVTQNGTQHQQQTIDAVEGVRRCSRSVTSSTAVYYPRFARHSAYSLHSLFTRLESIVVNCDHSVEHLQQQPTLNGTACQESSSSEKKKKKTSLNWIYRRRLDTMAMSTIKDCSAETDGTTDPTTVAEPPLQGVHQFEKNSLSCSNDNSTLPPQQDVCASIPIPSAPNDDTVTAGDD